MKSLKDRLPEKIKAPRDMNRKDRRKLMKEQYRIYRREVLRGDKVLGE